MFVNEALDLENLNLAIWFDPPCPSLPISRPSIKLDRKKERIAQRVPFCTLWLHDRSALNRGSGDPVDFRFYSYWSLAHSQKS